MMSWGIMFSDLNLSAQIKKLSAVTLTLVGLSLLSSNTWAQKSYSDQELRSAESSQERQIRELREQEITQLRIALGRRVPQNRRADLYFRLSEIYREAYRAEFFLEGRVHEKRIDQGSADSKIDRSHSLPFLHKGIQACKEVLSFNIPYEKMDEIYFSLGFYYGELDQSEQSLYYYRKLTDEFPQSRLVGAAYKFLGDLAYKKVNYPQASEYFQKALKTTPDELSPPILHKLAWCFYRTRKYDLSISTMKDVVSKTSDPKVKFGPLKDEALRDLASLMTELGHADEAIRYFQSQTGDQTLYPKLLEKLGAQYERNVDLEKARLVYESLMKTHPQSASASHAFVQLVEMDLRESKFRAASDRFAHYQWPNELSAEHEASIHNLRVKIRKLATEHHQKYRKKKESQDLDSAGILYAIYINHFLSREDSHHELPEIQMYLAELKKDQGKSSEAVDLYRKILATKDTRFVKEAQLLWAESLAEVLKKNPVKNVSDTPNAIEREYVSASDLMLEALGDTDEARSAALRVAQLLAAYKTSWPEAISRIKKIIEKWPNSPQALTAASLWLQIYLDHQRAPGLSEDFATVVKTLLSQTDLMRNDQKSNKGKLKAALQDHSLKLKVDEISADEKNEKFSDAAQKYLAFAEQTQDRVLIEKSFANAIQSLLKAHASSAEIQAVFTTWSAKFSKSKAMIEPLRVSATHSLIRGEVEVAAQSFFQLGKTYGEPEALETAARLYQALNMIEKESSAWSTLLNEFPKFSRRSRAALKLAQSYEKLGQEGQASRYYKMCAEEGSELQAECLVHLAQLYEKSRDLVHAQSTLKKVASIKGGKGKSVSPYIGYARFQLAVALEADAQFEPLALPEAQLQKAVAQRLAFLEPLTRAYQSSMEVGGPWAVAALNRLALWLVRFADEVDRVAPPSSYQQDSIARFKKSLSAVSAPLREKAKVALEQAYVKAVDLQILSPALPEVLDQLVELGSKNKGKAQGFSGGYQIAGSSSAEALKTAQGRLLKNTQDAKAWSEYGNLLWLEGKPLVAQLAYEKALSINPKDVISLNNLAVMSLMTHSADDWVAVAEAKAYLLEGLKQDEFFVTGKFNLALLLNYYRIFPKSKSLLEQVRVKLKNSAVQASYAIALQGMGQIQQAEAVFQELVTGEGLNLDFVQHYHSASRSLEGCIGQLRAIDEASLKGFEKSSVERLKAVCEGKKGRE